MCLNCTLFESYTNTIRSPFPDGPSVRSVAMYRQFGPSNSITFSNGRMSSFTSWTATRSNAEMTSAI